MIDSRLSVLRSSSRCLFNSLPHPFPPVHFVCFLHSFKSLMPSVCVCVCVCVCDFQFSAHTVLFVRVVFLSMNCFHGLCVTAQYCRTHSQTKCRSPYYLKNLNTNRGQVEVCVKCGSVRSDFPSSLCLFFLNRVCQPNIANKIQAYGYDQFSCLFFIEFVNIVVELDLALSARISHCTVFVSM